MLIVCPSCATSYDVELASLLPEGRYVRCQRCRMVWHAAPSHADKLLAAAAALAPEPIHAEGMLEVDAEVSQPEPVQAAADIGWSDEAAGELLEEPPVEARSFAATDDEHAEDGSLLLAADGEQATEEEQVALGNQAPPAEETAILAVADDECAEDGSHAPTLDDEPLATDESSLPVADNGHAAAVERFMALAEQAAEIESLLRAAEQPEEEWAAAGDDEATADEVFFADEQDGSAEIEAPPPTPVDLDEDWRPIEIDEDRPLYPAKPVEMIQSVAAWPQLGRARHWSLPRWPLSRLHTGILALLIVDCFLVGWRGNVVRAFPQTDSFYRLVGLPVNLRGLAFDGVATRTERDKGVPILVVEGNVINSAPKSVDVPRLKFVVRNAARQEIWSWTALLSRTLLPPGEAVSFRTRLASPPPGAHDVVLRFVDRRDIVVSAR